MHNKHMVAVTVAEFEALLEAELPLASSWGLKIEEIGSGTSRVRLPKSDQLLRPGGSIVGPAMMMIADVGLYAAIIGQIGLEPMAVTSCLTTNFLRRPALGDLVGECRMIKIGRRLAYGEVTIFCDGEKDQPVCHATGTYALPHHFSEKSSN